MKGTKLFLLGVLLILWFAVTTKQVNLNTDSSAPEGSSMLDINIILMAPWIISPCYYMACSVVFVLFK
jgi:hypothetical protein